MKLKYKLALIFIFIFCILASIPTKVNAQTLGSLARNANNNIEKFFTMSIDKYTDGSTDVPSRGEGTERRVWYCFNEGDAGRNKAGMKTAVLDVGHDSIDEVKNQDKNKTNTKNRNITLSVKNSQAARCAMRISYFATKSYMNNEKWGRTQTAPYRLAMQYYTGYYATTMKKALLFNEELNQENFPWTEKFYNAEAKEKLTNEAADYVDGIKNFDFSDQTTESKVRIITSGSYTFVGPYKVKRTGGSGATLSNEITSIVLTDNNKETYSPIGWSTSASTSSIKKNIEIPNGNTFYLAFKTKKITSVKKVVIKMKLSGILKSRIVFCGGNDGQDIGVYAGKFISEIFSIELPGTPYSSITIKKRDTNTKDPLPNVQFIVHLKGKGYLKKGNPVTYEKDKANASKYKTGEDGTVTITGLKDAGEYTVYEIKNPNEDYKKGDINNPVQTKTTTVDTIGQSKTVTFSNTKYSKITIVKTDGKNEKKLLPNVEFIVYLNGKGYLKKGNPVTYTDNKAEASKYKTGEDGSVTINNLVDKGTYTAYEINNPNEGYLKGDIDHPVKSASADITASAQNKTIKMTNDEYSKIIITKKDEETGAALANVQFIVYCSGKGYLVNANPITYTNDKKSGTIIYKTDSNGTATIDNIKDTGTYTIYEVYNPNKDYIHGSVDNPVQQSNVEITAMGQTKTASFINKKLITTNFKKVDETTRKPLKDVEFIVYCNGRGYVKDGIPATYVSDKNQATKYRSDANGNFTVSNLPYAGIYSLHEIKNPYPAYKEVSINEPNKIWENLISKSEERVIEISNPKIYTKLTGYVWVDGAGIGKASDQNGLYVAPPQESDWKLKDVVVKLKHKPDNKIVGSTQTNENGAYVFERILISDLANYEVIFEYNGMSYEAVNVSSKSNGSKAKENIDGETRSDFNNKFATINKGQSNGGVELKYNNSSHVSKLELANPNDAKYGLKEGTNEYKRLVDVGPVSGVYPGYVIKATSGKLTDFSLAETLKKEDDPLIEDINLGLKIREQPNLSLVNDVHTVKVNLNGESNIYKYSDRILGNNNYHHMSPQVKFDNKGGNSSYTRALYPSDIKYEGEDAKKLKVQVTYQIEISNNSSYLTSVVNQVIDYFDAKYDRDSVVVGKECNDDGSIKTDGGLKFNISENNNDGYYYTRITGSLEIPHNETRSIYVQLTVKPNEIVNLVDVPDTKDVNLYNVAEITSYSTKENGKAYAGIDQNSQPENFDVRDYDNTYEDDTDEATGLKLVLQEDRKVSGVVFVDSTEERLKTGETRKGDGEYKFGEDGELSGVEVKLEDENGNEVKIWDANPETGGEWKDATTTTGTDGTYEFSGILPGKYKVVYTWGDGEHRVQDYKCTVVDKTAYEKKGKNPEWYKDEFKRENKEWNSEEDKEKRVSDALDNYTSREDIDGKTNTITYGKKGNEENTTMDSTTLMFKVNYDYTDESGKSPNDIYQTNTNNELQFDSNGYILKRDGYQNIMKSIDFGIVERARQILALEKQVTDAKISLATGQTISHVTVKDDGTIDKGSFARYIEKSAGADSQIIFEIPDGTIKQSAKLDLEYELKVTNISELDYNNEEFYFYGTPGSEEEKVTLSAEEVIDYFDNNIVTDTSDWNIIKKENRKRDLLDSGLLVNNDEMENYLENRLNVGTTNALSGNLKPMQGNEAINSSKSIKLKASKLLANTANDQDSLWGNNAEIIKISKNGGSTLVTTPGNYIPGDTTTYEDDNASSESVVITSPTGLEINYIAYVLLAVSSLGILLLGIILIKKYIIKK